VVVFTAARMKTEATPANQSNGPTISNNGGEL
jgi:hypothetical protein